MPARLDTPDTVGGNSGSFAAIRDQLDWADDGAARVRRGKAFERLTVWFLRNAPRYRFRLAEVWEWNDWPGRGAWGSDDGIDIVARTTEGDYWAVQCKAVNPALSLRRGEIDSFLVASNGQLPPGLGRDHFSHRLLVSTTAEISLNVRRALDREGIGVGLVLADALAAEPLVWPAGIDELEPVPLPRKRPRKHQIEAIDAVRAHLRGQRRPDARTQLIACCGSGKTLQALWLHEREASRSTLVLVPSIALIDQTLRQWESNSASPFRALVVCSDPSVAGRSPFAGSQILSEDESPADLGIPVTTDPEMIAAFLRAESRPARVVFSTYQSSPRVAEALARTGVPSLDLAICDEAHRLAGQGGTDMSCILDADRIPCRTRVFLTATPRILRDRQGAAGSQNDLSLVSMDDEQVFGSVAHELPVGRAIAEGLLCDYKVLVIAVDKEEYRQKAATGAAMRDGQQHVDPGQLATQAALLRAMVEHRLRRVVSFHSRVERARSFSEGMRKASEPDSPLYGCLRPRRLISAHVDGEMAMGKRRRLLDSNLGSLADAEYGHLANARCLGEGIDVPALDAVAIVDPRASEVEIAQMVGRVLRHFPGKSFGYVVVPVFVSPTDAPENALDRSRFRSVWRVVRALRAHDTRLAETLDVARASPRRPSNRERVSDKVTLCLPESAPPDFFKAFAESFSVRLVTQTTESRVAWLRALDEHVATHGHALVDIKCVIGGAKLGQWVATVRSQRRRGLLPEDLVAVLDGYHGWEWNPSMAARIQGVRALREFATDHGHAQVPFRYMAGDFPLGRRVREWRLRYHAGLIDSDLAVELEATPGWTWRAIPSDPFAHLDVFVSVNGHARVPSKCEVNGFKLGNWAARQRRLYRAGDLDPCVVRRLEALAGWVWELAPTAPREGVASAVEAFMKKNGHWDFGDAEDARGTPLVTVVARVRAKYRKGTLDSETVAELEAIQGWEWQPASSRRTPDGSRSLDDDPDPRREAVILALQEMSRGRRKVTQARYRQLARDRDLPTLYIVGAIFGSWPAALQAAGVKVPEHLRRGLEPLTSPGERGAERTREPALGDTPDPRRAAVVSALQDLGGASRKPVTVKQYDEYARKSDLTLPAVNTIYRMFGSWADAAKEAGIESSGPRRGADKETMLRDIRTVARALGRVPTTSRYDHYRAENKSLRLVSSSVIRKWFTSWSAALAAAGIEENERGDLE